MFILFLFYQLLSRSRHSESFVISMIFMDEFERIADSDIASLYEVFTWQLVQDK